LQRPELRLDGAPDAPLPQGTRINVRYGANQRGEAYVIGEPTTPQAVHCSEDTTPGGAPADSQDPSTTGAGGSPGDSEVWGLNCQLYTQGPAQLDVDASGYEPIMYMPLDHPKGCELPIVVTLEPLKPRKSQ
jgi:hypothetical protein